MKKSIFRTAILFSIFSLVFISCDKDDDEKPSVSDEEKTASYEFKIDGQSISTSSSVPLGIGMNSDGGTTAGFSVSETENSFGMLISSPPNSTNNTITMDSNAMISITGSLIAPYTDFGVITIEEGSITRDANDKVSFEGTFEHDGTIHAATGFIKSSGMIGH